MALKSRVNLSTRQGLSLSSHMRAALAVLRMPTAELLEDIAREAADNPFLVVEGAAADGMSAYDHALATAASPESLNMRLARQLALQRLDAATEAAAFYLIGELREDGYLDVTLEEVAERSGAPLAVLAAGLRALQRCEPAGIGARDLPECLALQLVDSGIAEDLARRVVARLDDFAEARWRRLEPVLMLPVPELERIADLLRRCTSRPVQSDDLAPVLLIPEIRIDCHAGRAEARLNPSAIPAVRVLPAARQSLTTAEMRGLHDRAGAFSRAVAARLATLLRIAGIIAERQQTFFLDGQRQLAPLRRHEVALALGLHPATVGRATAGKALIADGRVYPFGHFFARGLAGQDGEISPFDVQRRIRALIEQEDSRTPLADAVIQSHLEKEGVDIARRTVAKYRKCMRIPSSFARRNRKSLAKDGPQAAPKH